MGQEFFNFSKNKILSFHRKLVLNSLLVNSNTLPVNIDIEHTHEHFFSNRKSSNIRKQILLEIQLI